MNTPLIHPHRLIQAAEAILEVQKSRGKLTMFEHPYPPDQQLDGCFTSAELIEAYMFLFRLGAIETGANDKE